MPDNWINRRLLTDETEIVIDGVKEHDLLCIDPAIVNKDTDLKVQYPTLFKKLGGVVAQGVDKLIVLQIRLNTGSQDIPNVYSGDETKYQVGGYTYIPADGVFSRVSTDEDGYNYLEFIKSTVSIHTLTYEPQVSVYVADSFTLQFIFSTDSSTTKGLPYLSRGASPTNGPCQFKANSETLEVYDLGALLKLQIQGDYTQRTEVSVTINKGLVIIHIDGIFKGSYITEYEVIPLRVEVASVGTNYTGTKIYALRVIDEPYTIVDEDYELTIWQPPKIDQDPSLPEMPTPEGSPVGYKIIADAT